MPRKLRVPKSRRVVGHQVSEALFILLTWHDWHAARAQQQLDGTSSIELWFPSDDRYGTAWRAIEPLALEEWAAVYPGSRPKSWWDYSAPEFRGFVGGSYQRIQGAGRCHETGIPYIGEWESDPPLVESCAAYLDRLGLWQPNERTRVPKSSFASQLFSYALCVEPRRMPEPQRSRLLDEAAEQDGYVEPGA